MIFPSTSAFKQRSLPIRGLWIQSSSSDRIIFKGNRIGTRITFIEKGCVLFHQTLVSDLCTYVCVTMESIFLIIHLSQKKFEVSSHKLLINLKKEIKLLFAANTKSWASLRTTGTSVPRCGKRKSYHKKQNISKDTMLPTLRLAPRHTHTHRPRAGRQQEVWSLELDVSNFSGAPSVVRVKQGLLMLSATHPTTDWSTPRPS